MKQPLRERLTPELIKALEDRALTNEEVARRLSVNASYLSSVFNTISRKKPGEVRQARLEMRKLVEMRRQLRIREAKKVLRGTKTLDKAARAANCSERTMRRYVEKIAPKEPSDGAE